MVDYSLIEDCGQIEKMAAALGRKCGNCSMCCKLMAIPEMGKPAGPWCAYCDPGKKRCTIYATRPKTCADFYCQWMVDRTFGPEWYPSRCKMVLKLSQNDPAPPALRLDVNVEPAFPNAWRLPPYHERLKAMSAQVAVCVSVGPRRFVVSPGGDTEFSS